MALSRALPGLQRKPCFKEKQNSGFVVHAVKTVFAPDITLKSGRVKPGEAIGEEAVSFRCDRVIVAVGGAAAPIHGTDGTSYGLLTELGHSMVPVRPALSALLTDSIRAMLLEDCGYSVDVLEFVDLAHSPKNLMLRCCKTKQPTAKNTPKIKQLMEQYHFEQRLFALLKK